MALLSKKQLICSVIFLQAPAEIVVEKEANDCHKQENQRGEQDTV